MLHRGPIIVDVEGLASLFYTDCSKITDTIVCREWSELVYSNEQWIKYKVADNIEIENKIEGSLTLQFCVHPVTCISTVTHLTCSQDKMLDV